MKTSRVARCFVQLLVVLTSLGLVGSLAAQTFVGINAPGGTSNFTFAINASGTNIALQVAGDAVSFSHLALRAGQAPSGTNYDFIARLSGTTNAINLQLPEVQATNYFAQVRTPAGSAIHAFTLTLKTNQTNLRSAALPVLKNLPFTAPGTLTPGSWHYFQIDVPAGLPGLRFVLSSTGAGNPDLFIRRGALPDDFNYAKGSAGQPVDTIIFTDAEATADTYFVGVRLPAGAAGTANYTLSAAIGYFSTLTWDPGTTATGTQVFDVGANSTGGDYFFKINTQNTAVGAWRTALRVITGEAEIYLRQGDVDVNSGAYSYQSARVGSDGFVLHSSQFDAAQEWSILVRATPGAQWTLVSGEAFVHNLGPLAADASSSTNVTIGPEGMVFFKTTAPSDTLAWALGVNGGTNYLYVKKSAAPHPYGSNFDLAQTAQLLVVPDYLAGTTFNGSYFVGVPGNPNSAVNLYSRKQAIVDLPFSVSTNVNTTNYGYVTFRIQVPVQQIAWQVNVTPTVGDANVAIRRDKVPSEWNNDAFSEVAGSVTDSVTLVPPTLSDGTFYVTVYGAAGHHFTLTSGNPVITDIGFISTTVNDAPTRAGWRLYRVPDIQSQLGYLGWNLFLQNQVAGTEIDLRRNAVPGRWNYRDNGTGYYYSSTAYSVNNGYVDYSGPNGFLQRPGHQADIWYVGVYNPAAALGSFTLNTGLLTATPLSFDAAGASASVVNQPDGKWNFYRVTVPANALGWDIRLVNVTAGSPAMVVRRDLLPESFGTSGTIYYADTWPSGNQWAAGQDWTGRNYAPGGQDGHVNMLAMGMGRPLEAGTYYVGVYAAGNSSYTLQSRGIGSGFAIPVVDLPLVGGAVTNTLAPREAAYYRVQVPTNTPSWRARLRPTTGEALLLEQSGVLPNVSADLYHSGGGKKMQKAGNEHYLGLPSTYYNSTLNEYETYLPAGIYYLAVVGEGRNPVNSSTIGTNTTTYVLETLGALPVVDLGTLNPVGGTDLVITNQLEGGAVAAYRVNVPGITLVLEARLENRVGEPWLGLGPGTNLFSTGSYAPSYGYDYYGNDGGPSGGIYDASLLTFANPTPGEWRGVVMARNQNGDYPDASYVLRLKAREPDLVAFNNGVTNVATQVDRTWRYFKIVVPPSALGWDIRLVNVTVGSPAMMIRRDLLPEGVGNIPYYWTAGYSDTWPSGNQWAAGQDWTGRYYAPDGQYAPPNMLAMGMGRPLEAGTYYVGVYATGDSSYTLQSRGIGSGLAIPVVDLPLAGGAVTNTLAPREAAYYRVQVPTNTPSWRARLRPTTGEALLLEHSAVLPNVVAELYHYPGGKKMQKAGNEHYLALPSTYYNSTLNEYETYLPAGMYYLAVVGEGRNPANGSTIGTNTTTYVLETLDALPVVDLGMLNPVGGADLVITNQLEGGAVAAYRVNVPGTTLVLEARLENRVGEPWLGLGPGTNLFAAGSYAPSYGYDYYGNDGGLSGGTYDASLMTFANPTPGEWRGVVMARNQNGDYPDASYVLRLKAREPDLVSFNNGVTNVTAQLDRTWRYFKIVVPSAALGWDIRLVNVTVGSPAMMIRRDLLPAGVGNIPYYWDAGYSDTWPSGNQWAAGQDWTGRNGAADGQDGHVSMLAMGMGRPLEAGTYYVGVYATGDSSYTLQSRGIGSGFAIPVVDLPLVGGAVTNTLAPREAAYYRVQVPTNTPSWRARLRPTTGEALLLEQFGVLPNVSANLYHYGGGKKMQKAGNEHYLGLPSTYYNSTLNEYETYLPAGIYYLAVVGEGRNPVNSSTIGTNTTTYVLETLGALPVVDLGTLNPVGGADLVLTNQLAGGTVAAYRVNVPGTTLVLEARLENRVGEPWLGLGLGTNLFSAGSYAPSYGYDYYGNDGGLSGGTYDASLMTFANPTPGEWRGVVMARNQSGDYPDASYVLRVKQVSPPPLNFSAAFNTNGLNNTATGNLADNQRAYFKVTVPATNAGLPVIGWSLRLTQSQGSPTVRVRRGGIPSDTTPDTTKWGGGTAVIVPPFLVPGDYFVEVRGGSATTFTLTSEPVTLERPAWVMPAAGQVTTVTPGLTFPNFADTGTDINGVLLPPAVGETPPGDHGVDLARGDFHYYAIIVPTNNAGLLRAQLQAISGNPNLYLRPFDVPTLFHGSGGTYGSLYERALAAATQTEYANWVPVDGRNETQLAPGIWYLAVEAAGDSNVRYRLHLSVGSVQDLALNGGTFANQILAGGDWRYYRVQVPLNAPTNWAVSFSQIVGDAVMYVRDTLPPGQGRADTYYYIPYPDWTTDNKNQGPYATYDSPGTYNFTTPPLRPGATYYLGFRAVNDATFTVSTAASVGTVAVNTTVAFYGGVLSNTIPAGGLLKFRVAAPVEATRWKHFATNAAGVDVYLEQGTLPALSTVDHYYWINQENGVLNVSLLPAFSAWPWRPGFWYFVSATNTTGVPQPFVFRMDGRNAATEDEDGDGLPDAWEILHFTNTYSQAADGDADGDGVSNLNEFLEGTNPSDPGSFNPRLTVIANGGTVTRNPNTAFYLPGSVVNLTAAPSAGFVFAGWAGDAGGANNPLALTMTGHKTVTALFTPPNDNFTSRAVLSGITVLVANGYNTNATAEAGEPAHAGLAAASSVWWTWTAPYTGMVTIRTTDSSFDTVLAVYRGAALNSLIPVASGVGGPSSVTFYVAAGTVLQIAVDSRFGVQGTIVLRLEMTNVALHLLPPVRVLPSRDFRLDLQSVSGGSYLVQYSTNLTNWLDLTNLILGTSSISVTDTVNSATSPQRFYRVISP